MRHHKYLQETPKIFHCITGTRHFLLVVQWIWRPHTSKCLQEAKILSCWLKRKRCPWLIAVSSVVYMVRVVRTLGTIRLISILECLSAILKVCSQLSLFMSSAQHLPTLLSPPYWVGFRRKFATTSSTVIWCRFIAERIILFAQYGGLTRFLGRYINLKISSPSHSPCVDHSMALHRLQSKHSKDTRHRALFLSVLYIYPNLSRPQGQFFIFGTSLAFAACVAMAIHRRAAEEYRYPGRKFWSLGDGYVIHQLDGLY